MDGYLYYKINIVSVSFFNIRLDLFIVFTQIIQSILTSYVGISLLSLYF